jgi:hypothetical protein
MSTRSPAIAVTDYPLAQLAGAFALGVLAGTFLTNSHSLSLSNSVWLFVFCGILASGGAIAALLKHELRLATMLVVASAAVIGSTLAIIEKSNVQPNRVRRLLEEGIIKVGEPVELTGVLEQEPELAPERLFLRLDVRQIRAGTTQTKTSGVVMLLARASQKRNEQEFDALDLHYGATLRVMTRIERADGFRNPGVSRFTD